MFNNLYINQLLNLKLFFKKIFNTVVVIKCGNLVPKFKIQNKLEQIILFLFYDI